MTTSTLGFSGHMPLEHLQAPIYSGVGPGQLELVLDSLQSFTYLWTGPGYKGHHVSCP